MGLKLSDSPLSMYFPQDTSLHMTDRSRKTKVRTKSLFGAMWPVEGPKRV